MVSPLTYGRIGYQHAYLTLNHYVEILARLIESYDVLPSTNLFKLEIRNQFFKIAHCYLFSFLEESYF